MTAGEVAAADPATVRPETWKITAGRPDAVETAAVLAVLTALMGRLQPPRPEQPQAVAPGWDRAPADGFRPAGTWRQG
ncbi:hypothetical protein ACFCZ1_35500 [Streptomyces sp. NPDC056224]|uniref:hypothetical protein n=1 Tax=Streptomyces sp. NPDC056224 TaxID=3345750 RepID=UPI0035D6E47A